MTSESLSWLDYPRRNVRRETLVRLRWLSVAGQTAAVLVVSFGFDFDMPLLPCLAAIALGAWLNVMLLPPFRLAQRLEAEHAAWLLAFDVAQLSVLLFLTGGLENPFAFLITGPVLISATALPPRHTLLLGVFAILCATALIFLHLPLPWGGDEPVVLPPLYLIGVWFAILLCIGFIGVHAALIAEEARKLADALTATELALAREQHLSQLDGLAAAAAHELGTPLATIAVIARELERGIDPGSQLGDDVRLLREQAQRCRDILGTLAALPAEGGPLNRLPLSALIEEVVEPHRHFGIAIDVDLASSPDEPSGPRNPGILYGLGNLVENAVDFASAAVEVTARWSEREIALTIADDGPGFAPEVVERLGEPYFSDRSHAGEARERSGLGLGFFIAKTLLERSGATLAFANRKAPEHGAVVRVRWPRVEFEQPEGLGDPAAVAAP
jgi:two-component system sensor histidine kinase RegB